MDEVDQLYDKVDSLLHQLTLQSNRRVQALELVQMLAAQDRLHQVWFSFWGPAPDLSQDPDSSLSTHSLFVPLQIEAWLQQVGWPALEVPKEPSLHVLLQACGSFQELDQIAQVRLLMCSFYQCGWKQV